MTIKSKYSVQTLLNQYTYMLGIDTYSNNDIVPLLVSNIKKSLKIIIKRSRIKKRKGINHE